MTTPNQVAKAGLVGRTRLIRDTEAEIRSLLQQASDQVVAILAKQPSDYQRWHLPALQAQIRRALIAFGDEAATAAEQAQGQLWRAGEALTTDVLGAGGVRMILPVLDVQQLRAMSAFLTERVAGISVETANAINTQLGLVVIGTQTPFDAIKSVQALLGESTPGRANTIVRTELARAFSTANQARMTQASKDAPGLRKRWVKSGKLHPRLSHAIADGQTVPVDQPFVLSGGVELMYPHDPAAPASETVNCGCASVPVVSGWVSKTRSPSDA